MALALSAFLSLATLARPAAAVRIATISNVPTGINPNATAPSSDVHDDTPEARNAALATWSSPKEVRRMSPRDLQAFEGALLADCFALNGNGFDWASTLAFLGEALEVRAKEADDIEAGTGAEVLLYLDCIVGGSSGSAAAGVYHSLLRNDELWKGFPPEPPVEVSNLTLASGVTLPVVRLFSARQTHLLSRAMRFISLGVDFAWDELAMFLPYYFGGSRAGSCEESRLHWWTECINPMVVKTLFAEHALMARYLTRADFEGVTIWDAVAASRVCYPSILGMACRRDLSVLASRNGVEAAVDILMSHGNEETDPEFEDKIRLFQAQHYWAMVVGHRINQRLYSKSSAWYSRRFVSPSIMKDTPLNHMLNETLTDGHAAAAFTVLYNSEAEMMAHADRPPLYEDVRVAFITTENTAKLILASEHFQQDLRDPEGRSRNFLILVVETYFEAFNVAVREPFMLPVLSGSLADLGVLKIYDPQFDLQAGKRARFELRDVVPSGIEGGLALAVVGGYPDANIMAQPQAYLVESMQREFAQAAPRALRVHTQQSRFLKSVTERFAHRVIRDLLSAISPATNPKGALREMSAGVWVLDQPATFCSNANSSWPIFGVGYSLARCQAEAMSDGSCGPTVYSNGYFCACTPAFETCTRSPSRSGHSVYTLLDMAWTTNVKRTACANQAGIIIGSSSTEAAVSDCGRRCLAVDGCVGFGYSQADCSEPVGTCRLWSGACDEEPADACTDTYILARNVKRQHADNWADYQAFDAAYEEVWPARLAALGVEAKAARVNWGLEGARLGLPRAAARESYHIIPRSLHAVREQMDGGRTYPAPVFPEGETDDARRWIEDFSEESIDRIAEAGVVGNVPAMGSAEWIGREFGVP